tara:strand:+ start:358 stop:1443 length:1086 start_codon:yes stop_codon:yes gene_type:complete
VNIIKVPEKEVEDFIPEDFGGKREVKTACVVRYGGFGDMIQTASIFPRLKEQGYRVCLNVTERGSEISETDPNVDEILFQKTDQIPGNRLTEYWEKMSPCFDKFIQLSESIEGKLLIIGPRFEQLNGETVRVPADPRFFDLNKEEIHKICNKNYMEETHDVAQVPHEFAPKFFPTKKEIKWARDTRRRMKSKNVIVWSLSGSSVHKVYPWTDQVISRILLSGKDVSFVTVGDELCQLLELGWEKEKKVITKSGKWSIRKTLAFLEVCDIVIGPETGVLNSASTLDCHKIVMLSHSSKENLSKHWNNTTTLEPDYYPGFCYPCHKMHYGFKTCNRDEDTGGSMCAANIKPEAVVSDILENIK